MRANQTPKNSRKNAKPYQISINSRNYFMYTEYMKNLKVLHDSVNNDQKSNILSLVAFDNNRKNLRNLGFKFSDKQFRNALIKKENNKFTLEKNKRVQPKSKKPLNNEEKNKIIEILNKY